MTATMTPVTVRPVPQATSIGFGNVLRSEWTKLRSVRSTYWTAAVAVLATTVIGFLVTVQQKNDLIADPSSIVDFDPVMSTLVGFILAQLAIGTLAVMTITSEYGTGMIRATLGAVPQRRALLAAKGTVLLVSVFVVGEILSFGAFSIGQAILEPSGASVSLGDPGILRAVFGGGLYLTAVALFAFGLGALIRHTAGALSAFFGLLFGVALLMNALPHTWQDHVAKYLPLNAGVQIMTTQADSSMLSPWHGFLVLCAYGVVSAGGAFVLINRRDA